MFSHKLFVGSLEIRRISSLNHITEAPLSTDAKTEGMNHSVKI